MTTKKSTKSNSKAANKVINIPMDDVKPVGERSMTKPIVELITSMFKEFIEEGFSREDALELTKTVMNCPALAQTKMSLF